MLRSKATWLSFSAFLFDLCAVAAAWLVAYIIRFNGLIPEDFRVGAIHSLIWVLPTYGIMFRIFGLYRGMWVFASLPDLVRISKAVAAGALVVMVASVLVQPMPIVPRSVLVVSPLFLFLAMGGSRALYRATKEFYLYGGLVAKGKPVVVLGAGNAGASLARELSRSSEWRLVGLLDDDVSKHGREIYGYKVLGSISELPQLAETLKTEYAIIAIPSATVDVQRRVATLCVRAGVRALVLPALTDVTQGQAFLSRVRQIDLEDLLGRDPITIDTPHVEALLHDRIVMVTGAGGSIGSELCRQILRFRPAQLIAYDLSEFAIYRLTEEVNERFPGVSVIPVIGDAKDSLLLDQVMSRHTPHIVFHPARIFLGDAGSISLGFLAGALGYWGWRGGIWPIWFPMVVFAPFIADASITLARRLLRGEKFWQAHREHYYQRMVRSGIGHARTALTWYLLMVAGIMLAIYALGRSVTFQSWALAGWVAVLCAAGAFVDLRWRRFQSTLSDN